MTKKVKYGNIRYGDRYGVMTYRKLNSDGFPIYYIRDKESGKMEKISGIYWIRNMIDDKKYIGQSIDIDSRTKEHKNNLKNNKEENPILQNAYNKYGKENFEYKIIILCIPEKKLLDDLEILFIKYYKSHKSENGYNITWGGSSAVPYEWTEENRKRASIRMMGNSYSKNNKLSLYQIESMRQGRVKKGYCKESHEKCAKLTRGRKKKNNSATSKYVGISLRRDSNKFRIIINYYGKMLYFGAYETELEAAIIYNYKMRQLYGDNCLLNDISEEEYSKFPNIETKYGSKTRITNNKYIGVYPSGNNFRLLITKDNVAYNLGSFKYEVEAALAYNEAALELYGYKARLNIISEEEIQQLWELE